MYDFDGSIPRLNSGIFDFYTVTQIHSAMTTVREIGVESRILHRIRRVFFLITAITVSVLYSVIINP